MKIKSELQGIYPRIEVYPNKKRKHLLKALIENILKKLYTERGEM